MNDPNECLTILRRLLPNDGQRFLLCDATNAMQNFYMAAASSTASLTADSLITVAGRFGKKPEHHVEIGFYCCFGMFNRIELSLRYKAMWNSLFRRRSSGICKTLEEADQFFNDFRSTFWYRSFATSKPQNCSMRWDEPEDLARMYLDVMPMLKTLFPVTCCECNRSPDTNQTHLSRTPDPE